jgi:hypothetical protein
MNDHNLSRKDFLKGSVFLYSSILITNQCISLGDKTIMNPMWNNLKQAHEQYSILSKSKDSKSIGNWNLSQIMQHCAQSIEFSMIGFPDQKSKLFQKTVGSTAFLVFHLRGKMSHSLSDPIPGAEPLSPMLSIMESWKRLDSAIEKFYKFDGTLSPHFAYGDLNKPEYETAHTLHLANHWEEIQV